MSRRTCLALAVTLFMAAPVARAKDITLPPSGDNQVCSVTQGIGLVRVSITYSSPHVHTREGVDRKGHIWGELVPYGLYDLGYNNCKECPWRGGANENTVFTVSHDVRVEGQPLPAGSYGLFFVAGKEEWTVIFSKNHESWGAFWYDPAEDQLRVKVKASPCGYREWLTYDFVERAPDRATVALIWENLEIPFKITVDDMPGVYVANLKQEFRNAQAFKWENFRDAAEYCLGAHAHLDQGLLWAEEAVSRPGNGVENFQTLSTLANLQRANGKAEEAGRTLERAMALPTAGPIDIHQLARSLMIAGDNEGARKAFLANAKRFPNQWPVNVGLARAAAISGDMKQAASHARQALPQAPDEANRKNIEDLIKQYESVPAKK